jgi:hypothetical protein
MMGRVEVATSLDLGRIKAPVLVIYSPDDQIVDPESIVRNFFSMGAKRKKIIPYMESEDPSQHMLAGDILSPSTTDWVAEMILDFLLLSAAHHY